jgi:TRAP-type mannitol/chloroaromatic compound transport system substrate-binding protein
MKEKKNKSRLMPSRRAFLKKGLQSLAAGSLLGVAACRQDLKQAAGVEQLNEAHSGESIEWIAATTWPPNFPILGEGVQLFAKQVEIMSAGRLKIKVYGGGELIPPLEVFDAVSNGSIQIGHGAAYYWSGKIPAANFFAAVPFGFNAQQMNTWLISGGGWQLWQEIYAPYNIIPFPAGNTGVQMGGWFKREINSPADLQGLKMRIPGLGGKVLDRMGVAAVQIAGSEIYTSLERGVIDAAEWIGPYHDYTLGFHKIARYYYYPGWHEPGATLELLVNKQAFESLPASLQEIVRNAALRANLWMLSEFEAKNAEYLEKIVSEGKVELRSYPSEVMRALQSTTRQLLEELAEQDATTRKVWTHVQSFKQKMKGWNQISEAAILPYLQS